MWDDNGNLTNQIPQPSTMSCTVKLLMPSIGRWRELRVQGCAPNLLPFISAFPKESLTALTILHVDCSNNCISPLWTAISRSAPLRSLKFLKFTCNLSIPAALQTDPRLITHIELRGGSPMTLDSSLQSLRMFPNLRHAKLYPLHTYPNPRRVELYLDGYHGLAQVQPDIIHLPNLVSLQLVAMPVVLKVLMTRISAPVLQHLRIEFRGRPQYGTAFPVDSFVDFMSNSSPPLRQLIIRSFDGMGPNFPRALDFMGSIEELSLELGTAKTVKNDNYGSCPDHFSNALCVREASPTVLPLLKHITLRFEGVELSNLHVKMIKSRWDVRPLASRNVTRLRKMNISIPGTSTLTLEQDGGEPLRQLRIMEAEGLSLNIDVY
jgi:hypothetical protein